MKKEDIAVLAQILTSMREGSAKLELAEKNKDFEQIRNLKNEILILQGKIKEVLKNDK